MGWKLRNGYVSLAIDTARRNLLPLPYSRPLPPTRTRRRSSRGRRLQTARLPPHAAPVSTTRRRPASALAGDEPRQPLPRAVRVTQPPPARSVQIPTPPRGIQIRRPPGTSLRPRRRRGVPATATKSCARPAATPTIPCDGESVTAPYLVPPA